MLKKTQLYCEELYKATGDMLFRMKNYKPNAKTEEELAALNREHAELRIGSAAGQASLACLDETMRVLERMRTRLLTMMENMLFTA
ncbi:hypothetical protein [Paenibacillus beijingensis]|uniref:Uncharacterized protein n=1 Tax=Paenibacillus beijingensis TaxID=1126833 RepID=A0A0D5NI75_9BACL|nr:hypothetical protein [Paenibacillus beijingensis]AJY74986.1 hypothetical protein VN24_10825 [Paenibacillus beijingensis]